MFKSIACYISGKHIEVNGQIFLLGELSMDVLNILRDEYRAMEPLCDKIEELLEGYGSPSRLFDMRVEMNLLRPKFMRHRIFKILSGNDFAPNLDPYQYSNALHDLEALDYDVEEYAKQREEAVDTDRQIRETASKYVEIFHDVYAFNAMMVPLVGRLRDLEKLDAEHFATELYEYLRDPATIDKTHLPDRPERMFTLYDQMTVEYVPREIPGEPGQHAIYEHYYLERLQSFLKLDFYRALMVGHTIRRCKNCKLYFLSTDGFHTEYCGRPIPGKPGRNCRNQGAKNFAKEKAKNNPVLRCYHKAYNRVNSDYNRDKITEAERDLARRKLRDLRDEAISRGWSDEKAKAALHVDALYEILKIKRK